MQKINFLSIKSLYANVELLAMGVPAVMVFVLLVVGDAKVEGCRPRTIQTLIKWQRN